MRQRWHGARARRGAGRRQAAAGDVSPTPAAQTQQTSLTCGHKIVATLSLENNKIYETEELNFAVACVDRREGAWGQGGGGGANEPCLSRLAC